MKPLEKLTITESGIVSLSYEREGVCYTLQIDQEGAVILSETLSDRNWETLHHKIWDKSELQEIEKARQQERLQRIQNGLLRPRGVDPESKAWNFKTF